MKGPKRTTVYFDASVHRAVARKAARSNLSISRVVNEAVRITLAEDDADVTAVRARASEKNLDFADVVRSLKQRGKL